MQFGRLKRREFVALLGGTAAWPLAAQAQQAAMRRIGVLMNFGEDDSEGQRRVTLFKQTLQQAGWSEGRNVQFEMRWAAGGYENYRRFATELGALRPDVILAVTTAAVKQEGGRPTKRPQHARRRSPPSPRTSVLDGLMTIEIWHAPTDGATNVEDASTVEGRIVHCAQ